MEPRNNTDASCKEELIAISDSLEILGGKWKLRIMRHLHQHITETNTFKKIQREVEGISAKMLSKELQDLELNQLVVRNVLDTRPISVSYAITEYGMSAFKVNDSLVDWGLNHRKEIRK